VADTDTYRREVTRLVENGWRIEEETPERVTLVRRTVGTVEAHLVIAVLTVWWLMGVPNLLYGAYKYVSDSERTVVWKDGSAGERPVAEETGGAV
jgi:hypothetical protein